MIQTHEEINSVESREGNIEQESLEAEIRRLELRRLELRNETPGYDSRLRHDARFPDSVAEDAGASTHDDRLSLNGDEPPIR